MSFMSIGFLYPSEINSNTSRNVGAAIAMITNWCGNYIVVSITPVGKSARRSPATPQVFRLICPQVFKILGGASTSSSPF